MTRRTQTAAAGAVVIGLDSVTGLQTARLLARRGIPVTAVAANLRHPACRTRVCDRIVGTGLDEDALIATLLRLGPGFGAAPVLFPCTDSSVLALSRHRDVLRDRYRLVLPAPGVIETLVDKAAFQRLGEAHGFPLIAGRVLTTPADVRAAGEALRFPCVVKPAVKTPAWQRHTAAKVFRCDSADDLQRVYDAHAGAADALVVQEWIDGPATAHFTCNAYFDACSEPVATFVSQKLRQWPPEGGVGCFSRAAANDTVRDTTIRVFREVGHHGLAYLEMKYDARADRYYIIEPNVGRPTGRSAAADAAGVHLIYTQYCDALGLPLPASAGQPARGARWIYFRQDCQAAVHEWRHGALTPSAWVRSLGGVTSDALFAWRDPGPFFADLAKAMAKRLTTARRSSDGTAAARTDDYDLHGIVGVRVVNASAADRARVERHIGSRRASLARAPDIVVRFVDRLQTGALRYVEPGRIAADDAGLVWLRDGRRPMRARLVFGGRGRYEIVCERGTTSIPFLNLLVNDVALDRGCVAVHASAVNCHGTGVLMPAWAHGGKTTALAALLARGAQYVGDEWIFLAPDGARMHGVLQPLHVPAWQLAQMSAAGSVDRSVAAAADALAALAPSQRLAEGVRRRLGRTIDPASAFGPDRVRESSPLDVVMMMIRHESPDIRVEPCDSPSIVSRIEAATAAETQPLITAALARDFALAGHCAADFERSRERRALLTRAIAGKAAFLVYHPSRCRLDALAAAITAHCVPSTRERRSPAPPRGAYAAERAVDAIEV